MSVIPRARRRYKKGGLLELFFATGRAAIRKPIYSALSQTKNPLPILRNYKSVSRVLPWTLLSSADPYKLIWISPTEITYISGLNHPIRHGVVVPGDWDKSNRKFEDAWGYQGLKQYLCQNTPPEETPLYRGFKRCVQDGSQWGMKDMSEFQDRIVEIDKLVYHIQNNGYKSQKELINNKYKETRKKNNDPFHPVLNEIRVDIGRDGSILWRYGGMHRLAISKILGIEKIVVLVGARHPVWEEKRNKTRMSSKYHLCHPDMEDI